MDNIFEINNKPENQEIPEYWNFPLKGDKDLKIIQKDIENRFLSVQKGNIKADYLFNTDGLCILGRRRDFSTGSSGEEVLRETLIHKIDKKNKQFYNIFDNNTGILIAFDSAAEGMQRESSCAEFRYDCGKLLYIRTPGLFYGEKQSEKITNPDIFLKKTKKLGKEKWAFNVEKNSYWEAFSKISFNETSLELERENDPESRLACYFEIKDEKLILKQFHLESGIVKVIEAPLEVDQEKVLKAVLYEHEETRRNKSEMEELNVPWKDLPQAIGINPLYRIPLSLKT